MFLDQKASGIKPKKVKKYALSSQLQSLQILTNDDEVENWSLFSVLLAGILATLWNPSRLLETLPVSYALFLDLRDPFFKMLPVAIFLGKLL